MEPAISVQNLSAGYGSRTILENISFDVPAGQIVTILGGSGCGKSTLMKHMIGLYAPIAGDVLIHGKSIVRSVGDQKRAIMRQFGVAYQGGALFRSLSLVNLAPDLIEAILDGTESKNLTISALRKGIPEDWDEQRRIFG